MALPRRTTQKPAHKCEKRMLLQEKGKQAALFFSFFFFSSCTEKHVQKTVDHFPVRFFLFF